MSANNNNNNDVLDLLNDIGRKKKYLKTILSIKDFEYNKPLKIIGCERKITIYGMKIVLDLEEHIMFLPEKYIFITDEVLRQLTTGKYSIKKATDDGIHYNLVFELLNKENK